MFPNIDVSTIIIEVNACDNNILSLPPSMVLINDR